MKFSLSETSTVIIHKFDDFSSLAEELIPPLTAGSVAISGGSTYDKLFDEWAALKPDLNGNWYCAVDERCVPVTDPESNWGNALRKLFAPLGVPEQGNNNYDTSVYFERMLQNRFSTEPFVFNTLFLGVGDDGHTASLFPNSREMRNMKRNTLETTSPKGVAKRITMGMKMIQEAENVITVISGKNKKNAIRWLKNVDLKRPFVFALANRAESHIYLDSELYDLFEQE